MKIRIATVAVGTLLFGALWAAAANPPGCPAPPPVTTIANGATVCVGYQAPLYPTPPYPNMNFNGVPTGPYVGNLDGINPVQRFVNDDFADMNLNPGWGGQLHWDSTSFNAAYIGDNWSTVQGSLKYGSAIGMVGYAQIANLVMAMFGGDIANPGGSPTTMINGLNVAGHTTTEIEQALNEAIFAIANPSLAGSINTLAAQLLAAVQGAVTSANAQTVLESYKDLWVFAPKNSGDIELWTLFSVPEGGAALLYLMLAGSICLGGIRFSGARKAL
jgi:hypothetical protein